MSIGHRRGAAWALLFSRALALSGRPQQRAGPKGRMQAFGGGQADKKAENDAEVKNEQRSHGEGVAQGDNRKSAERHDRENDQKDDIENGFAAFGRRAIGAGLEGEKSGRADDDRQAADNAEADRKARERIRRRAPEDVLIDGGRESRCEVEDNARREDMMKHAATAGEAAGRNRCNPARRRRDGAA